MKINNFTKTILVAVIAIVTMITGCKKDNNNSSSTTTATDDSSASKLSGSSATADNAYNDVLQVAIESGWDNGIAFKSTSPSHGSVETNAAHEVTTVNGASFTCASYVLTPGDGSFPETLVVDFGQGCTSSDGITRTGKITYQFSGKLLAPGTTVSATFASYTVNGYQLEGTYSITNTSSLTAVSFVTKVTGGKITFPDANYYTYAGTKTITMTAGMQTPSNLSDDVYSINGSNSFASAAGNTLTDSITTTLTKAYACRFIQSGIVSFSYNKNINGTLDFGNGNCDSLATIKVGALTGNVTLR